MRRLPIIISGIIILLIVFFSVASIKHKQLSETSKIVLLKEAQNANSLGNLIEARELYKKAKENIEDANRLKEIQKHIEEINTKILFSSLIDQCSQKYLVKPKDTLFEIARKFNTTVNLIKRINNLKSDTIRPQQELKVNTCNFSVVIDKSQNLLFLKRADEIIKTYIVATGENNSTPTGIFKIIVKLPNPTWFKTGAVIPPDSPDNILGSRWLGLSKEGYGIHGTTDPAALGKHATMGCVRMSNGDVEDLYDIIPIGAEVTIID